MQEVCTRGSGVWDSMFPPQNQSSQINHLTRRVVDDVSDLKNEPVPSEMVREAQALPRFSQLSNDDERELKALLNKPGTFNVICTQDSFKNISDTEDEDYADGMKSENRSDDGIMWTSTLCEMGDSDSAISDDPGIWIVPRFEDPSSRRVSSMSASNSRERHSLSPTPSGDSCISSSDEASPRHLVSNSDSKYLLQYQKHVSFHLRQIPYMFSGIWVNPHTLSDVPDVFEMQSKKFPPVFTPQFYQRRILLISLTELALPRYDGFVGI